MWRILAALQPTRVGHGVRASEDPELLDEIVSRQIALEVCPTSNVHLGVYEQLPDVPLRILLDAGVQVALGADDPMLFVSRLSVHGLTDAELAHLARCSIRASFAPPGRRQAWLAEVDAWLANPPGQIQS